MKRITLVGILAVLMTMGVAWFATADQGEEAALQAYVAANPNAKLLLVGDSWMHGGSYAGKSMLPSTGRPYNWASMFADSAACQGNEFGQQLARRLNTVRWTSLSVGSMELMLDDDANTARTQQDSSIFGLMRPYYAELYDPDIVVLPGGGGYNDIVAGSDYPELRAETIETAKRALDVFRGADWVVWIGPRPIGIYHYTRLSSGTDAERQVLAAAEYTLWQKFSTFVADTLRTELANDGVNVARFVTFDSRPYSTIAEADTAGAFNDADKFEAITQAQYDVVKAIRWSPSPWIQTENSKFGIHMTDYGNKCYADSLAQHLFGVTLSNTYTKGAGRTIYMSYNTGHNHLNRLLCESAAYPLKTLQAAVNQAHPGDIIRVTGAGNHMNAAYETSGGAKRSADDYEATIKKPGLTIILDDGAYFSGIYDNSTTIPTGTGIDVGTSLLHPYHCSDGSAFDSLSHDSETIIKTVKPQINLDLTISGTEDGEAWISGYQYPLLYNDYTPIELKWLNITGGAATNAFYARNHGGSDMVIRAEDCTFYVDSSSTGNSVLGSVVWNSNLTSGSTLTADFSYSGYFKRCDFIGRSITTDSLVSAVSGPLSGFDFIQCRFIDPKPYTRWVTDGTGVTVPTGLFDRTRFINCEWYTTETDASNAHNAVYWANTVEDTTYFVNCSVYAPNITTMNIWDAGTQGTGCEVYAVGSIFPKAELGATDLTPPVLGAASTVTDGYARRCFATKVFSAASDTVYWGGLREFLGYDIEDDFGVDCGNTHASIGVTQYTQPPTIALGSQSKQRVPAYAQKTFWEILNLCYTRAVMADSSPLDEDTYFTVVPPALSDPGGQAQKDLLISEWHGWYTDVKGQAAGDSTGVILKFN